MLLYSKGLDHVYVLQENNQSSVFLVESALWLGDFSWKKKKKKKKKKRRRRRRGVLSSRLNF